ncbi:lysozyme [Actinopolymorpha singaporensis]
MRLSASARSHATEQPRLRSRRASLTRSVATLVGAAALTLGVAAPSYATTSAEASRAAGAAGPRTEGDLAGIPGLRMSPQSFGGPDYLARYRPGAAAAAAQRQAAQPARPPAPDGVVAGTREVTDLKQAVIALRLANQQHAAAVREVARAATAKKAAERRVAELRRAEAAKKLTRATSAKDAAAKKAEATKKTAAKPAETRWEPRGLTRGAPGIDVASHQGNVDWPYYRDQGFRFAYVKATEGTTYKNPFFDQQFNGSAKVGMLHGTYHFGRPDQSSGAEQARFFVANGGDWKPDGKTLPGELDIEFGEAVGVSTCYDLSANQIVEFVRDFSDEYRRLTGRLPVIYTNGSWWRQCVGNSTAFGRNPLWIASYNPEPGPMPGGWQKGHTFWQYTEVPIDKNYFNGSMEDLRTFANQRWPR